MRSRFLRLRRAALLIQTGTHDLLGRLWSRDMRAAREGFARRVEANRRKLSQLEALITKEHSERVRSGLIKRATVARYELRQIQIAAVNHRLAGLRCRTPPASPPAPTGRPPSPAHSPQAEASKAEALAAASAAASRARRLSGVFHPSLSPSRSPSPDPSPDATSGRVSPTFLYTPGHTPIHPVGRAEMRRAWSPTPSDGCSASDLELALAEEAVAEEAAEARKLAKLSATHAIGTARFDTLPAPTLRLAIEELSLELSDPDTTDAKKYAVRRTVQRLACQLRRIEAEDAEVSAIREQQQARRAAYLRSVALRGTPGKAGADAEPEPEPAPAPQPAAPPRKKPTPYALASVGCFLRSGRWLPDPLPDTPAGPGARGPRGRGAWGAPQTWHADDAAIFADPPTDLCQAPPGLQPTPARARRASCGKGGGGGAAGAAAEPGGAGGPPASPRRSPLVSRSQVCDSVGTLAEGSRLVAPAHVVVDARKLMMMGPEKVRQAHSGGGHARSGEIAPRSSRDRTFLQCHHLPNLAGGPGGPPDGHDGSPPPLLHREDDSAPSSCRRRRHSSSCRRRRHRRLALACALACALA